MTTKTLTYNHIQSRSRLMSLPKINWTLALVTGFSLCLLLFVFYIISINQLTHISYMAKSYTKEIADLAKENKAMELRGIKSDSLANVHQAAKELGFDKVSKIKYIEVINSSLAKANPE